jgi:MFS family permease
MLAHGISASVSFNLRRERSPERIRALLDISGGSYSVMYISLLILLLSGIVAGFLGQWWGSGWIWASLVLLIAIIVAMAILGGGIYSEARKAAGLPYAVKGKPQPALPPQSPGEIEAQLARANPALLTLIGYGGILVILWLMMFKPF